MKSNLADRKTLLVGLVLLTEAMPARQELVSNSAGIRVAKSCLRPRRYPAARGRWYGGVVELTVMLMLAAFTVACAILTSGSAAAATIVADQTNCTLVDAIIAANTNASVGGCAAGDDSTDDGDIVELTSDVILIVPDNVDAAGCANGLPAVTSRISINGNKHTIERDSAPDTPYFRLLDATAGALTLNQVTLMNGYAASDSGACDGGGINGDVTLVDSVVSGNRARDGNGGGINGETILTNSVVSGNALVTGFGPVGGHGGGINGAVTAKNSTISDNSSGSCNQPLSMRALDNLSARGFNAGGGIAGSSVLLIDSVVSGNCSGGFASIGGGLFIDGAATLINSTISGNHLLPFADITYGGGVFLNSGAIVLTNSTISGNRADTPNRSGVADGGSGGGIYSKSNDVVGGPGGSVTLIHSTVAGNAAEGIYQAGDGSIWGGGTGAGIYGDTVTLINSIVADNSATNPIDGDCFSTDIHYEGLNLIGDNSCGASSYGQLNGNPLLGPLANNGGPTATRALLVGSPALDRIAFMPGQGCGSTTVTTDQRGIARPQPAGGDCDLGAFEACSGGVTITDLAATPNPALVNSSIMLTAVANATACGSATVAGATYSIDGAEPFNMFASDGAFDGGIEPVQDDLSDTGLSGLAVGVHSICVTGYDSAGKSGAEVCLMLAVYDPEGGFVFGAGSFSSPVGALEPDPTFSGKAKFSFVATYRKAARTPSGTTNLHLERGRLRFRSTDYKWLVITRDKAILRGVGKTNGVGNYEFLLSVIDGKRFSKRGKDTLRIKIWNRDSGAVIYDNEQGSDENADPSTSLANGAIVIHK